ncbi:MAG: GumC family protein [Myxococcota bacterium]
MLSENDAPAEAAPSGLTAAEVLGMLRVQWKVIVAVAALVLALAAVNSLRAPKLYRANAVIQISSHAGQELRVDGVVDYNAVTQEYTYAKTQLHLLESRELREEVVRRYEALGFTDFTTEQEAAGQLAGMLAVTQRRDTELVDVSVTDTDPERAARLANLVAEVYREQTLGGRRDAAREAKEWLQHQLADYQKRIAEENAALVAYQRANDLADAEESVTPLSATMDTLNRAFGEVNTERVLLETTVRGHERLLAANAWEALAKDMNTPLVVALYKEYSEAAAENAEMSARYLEKMPQRVYAEAKLRGIEQELRREVERTLATERAQLTILQQKEKSLGEEIDATKSRLLGRQEAKEGYERLKLQLERSKQFYSTLSQRDDELELAARTHLSNIRVVDEARPSPYPVSPNVPRSLFMGLVVGLLLGAALGFAIEYVDDTISSPLDVANYLHVPLLGIVPRIAGTAGGKDLALYTHLEPNSPAAEAVRAIRTVLELNPTAKTLRRLLVTSTEASEGKTTTTVSLAVSFATRGRRVLIVDADMRRPRVHRVFEVEKTPGLSEILAGCPLEGAIVPTGIPGVDILPAGPRTDGPNELLASPAMAPLLDDLDRAYDLVLIDSPPAGITSDAAILSKLVDGLVFVVREKTVSRWFVRDVVHRLQQIGAPLLGVVVNAVDTTGRRSGYKYYYGYRYKYEEENKPGVAAK